MPRPLENPRIPGNSAILHQFAYFAELHRRIFASVLLRRRPGVTPRLTARNAPGPPICAVEPLFLPPAVNLCTD